MAGGLDGFRGRAFFLELDRIGYEEAWSLQHRTVEARAAGELAQDAIFVLEHPPVFTLGRRGGAENLRVPESFLDRSGIPIVHVERGGNITYHGPGQLVVYPIVDLRATRFKVVEFVSHLEEIMIRIARELGVSACRDPRNRGVWVGDCKLGSVGIAVRRGVSFHGLAFNVSPNLGHFGWINPCGLCGVGVTSLEKELGRPVSMGSVRKAARRNIGEILGMSLYPISRAAFEALLESPSDSTETS